MNLDRPTPDPRRPRAPFDAWPSAVVVPRIGFAWFADPAVLVVQSHIDHATIESATRVHDLIDRVLAAEPDAVAAAGGLAILHDWRSLRGHDAAARPAFLERMRRRPKGYLRMAVVVLGTSTRLLRLAVETGNLLAATVSGGRIEVVGSPSEAIDRLHARPSGRFPRRGT